VFCVVVRPLFASCSMAIQKLIDSVKSTHPCLTQLNIEKLLGDGWASTWGIEGKTGGVW
jgi:hypothetical protein